MTHMLLVKVYPMNYSAKIFAKDSEVEEVLRFQLIIAKKVTQNREK